MASDILKREYGIGEILKLATKHYKKRIKTIVILAAIFHIPIILCEIALLEGGFLKEGMSIFEMAGTLLKGYIIIWVLTLFFHLFAPTLRYHPAAGRAFDPVNVLHPKPRTHGGLFCLINHFFFRFRRGRGLGPGSHVQVAVGTEGPDSHFLVLLTNYFFLAKRTPSLLLL